jgi:formylglycine-generating enzyme required for sulfatase activity
MPGGPLQLGTDCSATCDPDSVCPAPPPCKGVQCLSENTPETDVVVTSYALDTFLVTVGRFRKFVDAYTGAPIPAGAGADSSAAPITNTLSGWKTVYNQHLFPDASALRASLKCNEQQQPGAAMWTELPGPNENKPINCVDWYHAFAFCIWDGGWLPIEAAWEYAAAGGTEDRLYPWGQPLPDATRVPGSCLNAVGPCDATTLPDVGSFAAGGGKWGHLDLTGFLGQWMQDGSHQYGKMQGVPNCDQPECFNTLDANSLGAVGRGGGGLNYTAATSAGRFVAVPVNPWPYLGVRCARH